MKCVRDKKNDAKLENLTLFELHIDCDHGDRSGVRWVTIHNSTQLNMCFRVAINIFTPGDPLIFIELWYGTQNNSLSLAMVIPGLTNDFEFGPYTKN